VIDIKNSATCFGSKEPSSGHKWKHSPGTFRGCTHFGITYGLQLYWH